MLVLILGYALHWVSVVRVTRQGVSRIAEASQNTVGNLTNFRKRIVIIIAMHFVCSFKAPCVPYKGDNYDYLHILY